MKRAVIYCRTAAAQDSALSLNVQTDRCRPYCERHDYEVIDVITDAGQSGCTLDRPGLARVRELVAARQADAVVVMSLDRFTRRADHWVILHDELVRAGVAIVIANEASAMDETARAIWGIYEQYPSGVSIRNITRRLTRR
jgi:site-specific DNA recombinase